MSAADLGDPEALGAARLLAIVRTQNEIAASSLAVDDVMGVVAASAMELTGADAGAIELIEGDEMVYRAVCGAAAGHAGLRLPADSSLSGLAVREHEVLLCDDAQTDPRVNREASLAIGAISMICAPLAYRGTALGVLEVYAERPGAFGAADVATLDLLSGVVGAQLGHAAEYERRAHESRHDALTGLGNRRAYDERLVKEVARRARYGRPLSLVLVDLDGFKSINDREGHPAGDEVLRQVAAVLRTTRVADECFRLGGDEFALLLPDTPLDGAKLVAGRVARRVRDAQLGPGGALTVSCGVASCADADPPAFHADADASLMNAKRTLGRARPRR